MPNIPHLERFIAVAEELNFRKAAARLNMSQPPLSDSVRQLEDELGTQLLRRSRRSVELTKAGVVFLDRARLVLSQLSEAMDVTQGIARGMHGHISIGFNPAASYEILPQIVRRFRDRFPGVSVGLEELSTSEREGALLQRRIDVALFHVPTIARPGIRREVILREHLIAVLPDDHPLAGQTEIDLQDLRDETFLLLPSRQETGNRARILYACQQAGFLPKDVRQVDRIHNAVSQVSAGLGVTLCPASVGRFSPPGAVYVPLKDPASELNIECGVSCRSDDDSALTAGFIDIAHEFGHEFMEAQASLQKSRG